MIEREDTRHVFPVKRWHGEGAMEDGNFNIASALCDYYKYKE